MYFLERSEYRLNLVSPEYLLFNLLFRAQKITVMDSCSASLSVVSVYFLSSDRYTFYCGNVVALL